MLKKKTNGVSHTYTRINRFPTKIKIKTRTNENEHKHILLLLFLFKFQVLSIQFFILFFFPYFFYLLIVMLLLLLECLSESVGLLFIFVCAFQFSVNNLIQYIYICG